MEPNPHILGIVHTASNHGRHKGSLRSTEHRHKVSCGSLLAGELGKNGQNESDSDLIGKWWANVDDRGY